MITLSNNFITIKIKEKGAELSSIQYDETEYLWQADKAYWAKHSPVLFPIVGELKDGKYIFKNKEYSLSRHGFARNTIFKVIQHADDTAAFVLHSSEETFTAYPFNFVFTITYRLENAKLFCSYYIENIDSKPMYFSVGAHPAFNVPLKKQLRYEDYFLLFNHDEVLTRYLLKDGLITDETEEIPLNNKKLLLHHSLFYKDAIVLKNIKSNEVHLKTDKNQQGITISFEGFPYFGIWASKDAPFLCLEPWCGIADNVNHDNRLVNKEGINKLAAGSSWERTWSMALF